MVCDMYILGHKDNYGFTLADLGGSWESRHIYINCILTLYVTMLPYCFFCMLLNYFKFSK